MVCVYGDKMTSKNPLSTKERSTSISRSLQQSNKKMDKPTETRTSKLPIITKGVATWLSVVGAGGMAYLNWCEQRIREGKGTELMDYIKEKQEVSDVKE
jgi:hypothetical protein